MKKFTQVKKEIKKLPKSKQEIANNLLDKAMFMDRELEKLQEILTEKGWTEEYHNGATQSGLKKSSEGDVYNTMIKNYTAVMKALADILPENGEESDELIDFLKGR